MILPPADSRRENAGISMMCIVAIFMILRMQCYAQHDALEESWRWVQFTTTSGLPSNLIRNVKDGPDGTPWVWTAGTLAWYDGFRWHPVNPKHHVPNLGNSLLCGFFDKGIVLSVKENYYTVTRTGMKPFPVDSLDFVWIINEDTAYVSRKHAPFRFTHGNLQPMSLDWWSEDFISGVGLASGRTLLQTVNRISVWDGKTRIPLLDLNERQLRIVCALENSSRQGIAIIGYPPSCEGIWEWQRNGPALRDAFRTVRQGMLAGVAENGDALIVYENDFVRVRRNGKWKTARLPNFVRDITSIQYRLNGDLWVGTQHGLFLCRLSLQQWTFHNWEEADQRNRVNNIHRSRDGTLWLATSGGVVRILLNGKSISCRSIAGKRIGIVTGLTEDREGNVWISSGADFTGVYRWDGNEWKHYPVQYHGDGVQVHQIACDSKGRLWFLGVTRGWDARTAVNPGVFTLQDGIIARWKETDRLPHQRVYSFAEGVNGALWFGTFDGLARLENGTWKIWKRFGGPVAGSVTTIAVDALNRVWFGMQNQGAGLGLLDNSDTIRYVTTLEGLPDDFIWDIKVDAEQKVWVTTQKGLACYNQHTWLTFDERTGLNETSIWPVLPEDSVVYVGNKSGGWAELRMSSGLGSNPRIVIDQPLIDHGHVVVGWHAYTAWGAVSPEEILTRFRLNTNQWSSWTTEHSLSLDNVDPGDYSIQVQAKGLFGQYDGDGQVISFIVPPPFVQRWYFYIPATGTGMLILGLGLLLFQRRRKYVRELGRSESRYRMITELMSDYAYLFQVREESMLKLIWMTDSFTRLTGYPAQAADEAGFMHRIVHPDDLEQSMREHQRLLDGNNLHLEHRIVTKSGQTRWVERRASPVYAKDGNRVEYIYGVVHDITARKESEHRVVESELKALRAQMNPHFFFNSLNAIQSFIVTNEKKLASEYLSKFARLMRLILENSRSPLVEINEEIEFLSLYIELEAIRFDQRFESTIDIGPEVDGAARIPSMLIQPYVENAIRHGLVHKGKGGKIIIALHRADHSLCCTIEDNGIGRGKAEEIRERQGRSTTRMGMQITKDRLDILNAAHQSRANVFIKDLYDVNGSASGTRVEISIPLRDSS
jgi:PAS domain S-box-containing protein